MRCLSFEPSLAFGRAGCSLTVLYVLLLSLAGCSDNGGSNNTAGQSVTITAPVAVSPADGAEVRGAVTLTVTNVTVSGGSTAVYTFQVASDSGFTDIVAQTSNYPEGSGGQTSWTLGSEVGSGELFWRARASAGGSNGPFSSTVRFNFQGGSSTQGKTDQVLLYDPLTNGTTLGSLGGGEFTEQGWKVIASSNFIIYDMEPIETGFLEFDITNVPLRNPHRDARHLFFMWDPSLGSNMTSNPFRVSLQKLDGRSSVNDRWLRLRFISGNRQQDFGKNFRKWTPEKIFRIRLEWGREGNVNVARLFIDGEEIFFFQYVRPYILGTHRIELGAAGRAETHEDAIYSNVVIGTR